MGREHKEEDKLDMYHNVYKDLLTTQDRTVARKHSGLDDFINNDRLMGTPIKRSPLDMIFDSQPERRSSIHTPSQAFREPGNEMSLHDSMEDMLRESGLGCPDYRKPETPVKLF